MEVFILHGSLFLLPCTYVSLWFCILRFVIVCLLLSARNWAEETIKELWDHIRKGHERDRFLAFDSDNDYIINKIHEHAENDTIVPHATQT